MTDRAGSGPDGFSRTWAVWLLTAAAAAIVAVTLFPYDFFSGDGPYGLNYRLPRLDPPERGDVVRNVFLFLPLGFAAAYAGGAGGLGRCGRGILALAAGLGLSAAVELLQIFLPARLSSVFDLAANTVGAAAGWGVLERWGRTVVHGLSLAGDFLRRRTSPRALWLGLLGYAGLMLLLAGPFQRASRLDGWDDRFHLMLGNEADGERPWRGRVREVRIFDHDLSEEQIRHIFDKGQNSDLEDPLAHYVLTSPESPNDLAGRNPRLVWQGDPQDAASGQGVRLGRHGWLKSEAPMTELSRAIRRSSRFTVEAKIATGDTDQWGPARIVSLSADPHQRNFTLGQDEGDALAFRLRTPATGRNGMHPALVVPGVFADRDEHHVIVTYNGYQLVAHVDGRRRSPTLELSPGLILFRFLFPADSRFMDGYKFLYMCLVFVPPGLLLAIRLAQRPTRRIPVVAAALLLLAVYPNLMERALAAAAERAVLAEHIGAGVVLMLLPFPIIAAVRAVHRELSIRARPSQ
ncbi:MAG: hypothetical protein GXY33_09245 [Phycisphaerae bacterium]|nr:hypothetical protein [Phycisphaerae bacterium]